MIKIGMIGSGNVATHLAKALTAAGYYIAQVYSRDLQHAQVLASIIQAYAINDLQQLDPALNLYIIAVKDSAIAEVVSQLEPLQLIGSVVHTSGSTDIDVLKSTGSNFGVVYPLQTFSKAQSLDFKTVPLLLEASDPHLLKQLDDLAKELSPYIYHYSSAQRRSLHLAAVIACNLSNYLYNIAHDYLKLQQVDFDLLKPLILETAQKVQQHAPYEVQTGPAVRGDLAILTMHQAMLKSQPDLQRIYDLLSKGIIKLHANQHR